MANKTDLGQVRIPIPSLEIQSDIINYLDYLYDTINKSNHDKILQLRVLNKQIIGLKIKVSRQIVNKKMVDFCKILPKSKNNAKFGKETGLYPFFTSSNNVKRYVDVPDVNNESLIIGDGGEPNINYGINFSASDHCFVLQNNEDKEVNLKYVYYYIHNNLDLLSKHYKGVGIKNMSKTKIGEIAIPILPLEQQKYS